MAYCNKHRLGTCCGKKHHVPWSRLHAVPKALYKAVVDATNWRCFAAAVAALEEYEGSNGVCSDCQNKNRSNDGAAAFSKRVGGCTPRCCSWGACTSRGSSGALIQGYCGVHHTAVTAIAQAALAEAQPGVAYDAAVHFALGHARVQTDPDTKKVPGKVYMPVKDRPTSAGAGSSTDPPPAPPS